MDVVNHLGVLLLQLGISNVAVAHEMVALDAGALGSSSVEEFLPSVHALADVHAAVVDKGCFYHIIAGSLEQLGHAGAQKVVADVPKVEGLVGIGRRELHHHPAARRGQGAEAGIGGHFFEDFTPVDIAQAQVQETLHCVERADLGAVGSEPLPYFLRSSSGSLARNPQQGEHYKGVVPFKIFASGANLHHALLHVGPVKSLYRLYRPGCNELFRTHQPRYDLRSLLAEGFLSLRMAFSLIWRTRSRVRSSLSPISSRVISWHPMPKKLLMISLSRGVRI